MVCHSHCQQVLKPLAWKSKAYFTWCFHASGCWHRPQILETFPSFLLRSTHIMLLNLVTLSADSQVVALPFGSEQKQPEVTSTASLAASSGEKMWTPKNTEQEHLCEMSNPQYKALISVRNIHKFYNNYCYELFTSNVQRTTAPQRTQLRKSKEPHLLCRNFKGSSFLTGSQQKNFFKSHRHLFYTKESSGVPQAVVEMFLMLILLVGPSKSFKGRI